MQLKGLHRSKSALFLTIFLSAFSNVYSQKAVTATVRAVDNGEVIPYISVYYPAGRSGVVADLQGRFSITTASENDSLIFTAVGYRRLSLIAGKIGASIQLEQDAVQFREVVIRANADRYYFQCIDSCRKYSKIFKGAARAVFHQSSTVDTNCVEVMDAYYNASCNGYELEKLELKTGKFGLKPSGNSFFIFYENAKAITLLPSIQKPDYFPQQPLCLSVEQMLKKYIAEVIREYSNEKGDRMLQLKCIPRDKSGACFIAEYTLNRTKGYITEVHLSGTTKKDHPFVPYTGDSIRSLTWNIHKSFVLENDTLCLRQVNFTYSTTYLRLRPIHPQAELSASTTAILHLYNHRQPFLLPSFNFGKREPDDFHKINAYGYNEFFWNNRKEFHLADQDQSLQFYRDPSVLRSPQVFMPEGIGRTGLYESPYIHWSRKRIRIRQAVSDTAQRYNPKLTDREQYELSVQLLAELDTIEGLHQLRTAVVIDPFHTYWHVPEDSLTGPFINIFFDQCEIKRRQLEEAYAGRTDAAVLKELQAAYADWFRNFSETYYREVQRGHHIAAMEKYAAEVERALVIRNFHAEPSDHPEEE